MREGGQEATTFLREVVWPAQRMILERGSASVLDLRARLLDVLGSVRDLPGAWTWPNDFEAVSNYNHMRTLVAVAWPELSFYDAQTGVGLSNDVSDELGDALDDLADLAGDFENALRLGQRDAAGALSWLRFTAETHWGEHIEELARYLLWLSGSRNT